MELGVFGLRGIDVAGVRQNLLRIPHVSVKIKEAQKVIENLKVKDVDLISIIQSDEKFHSATKEFKSFILSIFALGLYEKHVSSGMSLAQFIINENLDMVIEYIKSELLGEKIAIRYMDSHVRIVMKKGFFSSNPVKDSITPVSYGLCTSHARWLHRTSEEGSIPTMTYGLFFQFLSQAVRENNVTKVIYFGPECEELQSLKKVVSDRWPTVDVVSSISENTGLSLLDLSAAVGV